jgi:hypothetical protein
MTTRTRMFSFQSWLNTSGQKLIRPLPYKKNKVIWDGKQVTYKWNDYRKYNTSMVN